MVRMTTKDALNLAMEQVQIEDLAPGKNVAIIRENYAARVTVLALQILHYPEKVSRSLAYSMNGCARIRFYKALRRLEEQ